VANAAVSFTTFALGGELPEAVAAHARRLNYRLSQACTEDLDNLCHHVCNVTSHHSPCGGMALRCLQDKQDEVTPSNAAPAKLYVKCCFLSSI
jgi:hypothetical protein